MNDKLIKLKDCLGNMSGRPYAIPLGSGGRAKGWRTDMDLVLNEMGSEDLPNCVVGVARCPLILRQFMT